MCEDVKVLRNSLYGATFAGRNDNLCNMRTRLMLMTCKSCKGSTKTAKEASETLTGTVTKVDHSSEEQGAGATEVDGSAPCRYIQGEHCSWKGSTQKHVSFNSTTVDGATGSNDDTKPPPSVADV